MVSFRSDAGWTDARLDILRRLWAEGLVIDVIAERLGVTRNSIVGKAHRLKLPGRPSPIKRGGPPRIRVDRLKPKTAPKAEPPPKAIEVAISVRVMGGEPCCWPIGEPGRPSFRFCEQPTVRPSSYCEAHRLASIIPGKLMTSKRLEALAERGR